MGALLRKEWRTMHRGGGFRALCAALLLVAVVALAGTVQRHAVQATQARSAAQADYAQWLHQGAKYAHAAAHFGLHVIRPVTALANVEPGIGAFAGSTVWLEAHVQNDVVYRPAQDASFAERLSGLTPALLLSAWLPLCCILLGHGLLAGERERGTLRLALSQSGRPWCMAGAKLLVLGLVTLLPALGLLAVAAGVGWAVSADGADSAPDTAMRWALLALAQTAYAGFWSVLTLGVSARARSAQQALAVLLACWVLLCIVLPRALVALAAEQLPVPTQQAVSRLMRQQLDAAEGLDRAAQTQARLLQQHGVAQLKDLPVNWDGIYRQEGEDHGNAVFDAVWGDLYNHYESQQRRVAAFAWVSPATALQWLSQHAAGTDIQHQRRFVEAAEAHRRLIQRTLNQALLRPQPAGISRPVSDPSLWALVPPFGYHLPPLATVGRAGGSAGQVLLALLAACGLAAAFAWLAVRRLPDHA